MASSILAPFQKFDAEGATVGRLLAGYSNIEVGLLHCVVAARGGNLDTVLKKLFRIRGETRRINEAEKLALDECQRLRLATDFQKAIRVVRYCLKVRNQYALWVWWDDYSGRLAFANLEELAARKRPVKDLGKLRPHHVDAALLAAQDAYFVYPDRLLAWVIEPPRDCRRPFGLSHAAKAKGAPGPHLVYGFLTTSPNVIPKPCR
jgi:hypothetical protein